MKIILYIMTAVFLGISASVYAVQEYGDLSLLIGNTNGDAVMRIMLSCAAVCFIIISVIAIIRKEKHMILQAVIGLMISAAMFSCVGISSFFSRPYSYYNFTSPDGKYTVIAGEWSWLQGGGVTFYERKNPLFVIPKESFLTDDGYEAIKSGDYSVEWDENVMIFTADNGSGKYEPVEIIFDK